MAFYKECHSGELIFQTIGDSPSDVQMPEKMKDCILHSALTDGNMVLLGLDIAPPSGGSNAAMLYRWRCIAIAGKIQGVITKNLPKAVRQIIRWKKLFGAPYLAASLIPLPIIGYFTATKQKPH